MHGKGFLLSSPVGLEDRDQFSLLSTSAEPTKGLAAEHPSIRTHLTEQLSSLFNIHSLSSVGGESGNRDGEPWSNPEPQWGKQREKGSRKG